MDAWATAARTFATDKTHGPLVFARIDENIRIEA